MKIINSFSGEHAWLSNFWMAPITIDGWTFPSTEHVYQAAKSLDRDDWRAIQQLATPGQAKRFGKTVDLRPDWILIRLDVMTQIIKAKFDQHPDLKEKLLATQGIELVEGNNWNDTFWGVCRGVGENHLGKILMDYLDRLSSK
jgi:ribA/ribD-fused uncharacterized protein